MSLLSPGLQAFIVVSRIKTVHGAATELYITQTAVTQRIKTLETALKTTLFVRSRKGMKLTTEGEALLRYCHAAKELEGEAMAQIQGSGEASEVEVNITGPTSIMKVRVIKGCMTLISKFPNLLLHFQVEDSEVRHQMLRSGKADFAILNKDQVSREMKTKELKSEDYVLVCSAKWAGLSLQEIIKTKRIVDFDETDQMTHAYLKNFNLHENAQAGRYFVNRTDNLARLVCEGMGYTTLPKEITAKYVWNKEMIILNDEKSFQVDHLLAWYDRPEPPAYFSAIIDAIS